MAARCGCGLGEMPLGSERTDNQRRPGGVSSPAPGIGKCEDRNPNNRRATEGHPMENIAKQGGEYVEDVTVRNKSSWLYDVSTGSSMMRELKLPSWGRAPLLHAATIIVIATALLFTIFLAQRSYISPALSVESLDRSPESHLLQLPEPDESQSLPGALNDSGGNTVISTSTVVNEKRMRLEKEFYAARKDIQSATPADSDPSLYPSVYHNVGTFSKSYELMTMKFRIYVYQEQGRDGRVVHVGPMTGANCIEGRFLKIMSRRDPTPFITQDPEEAHMFYLPYSMEQMRLRFRNKSADYNENLRTLIEIVNDYVEEVAAKYPFWNRSEGRDHFMLACTDSGPKSVGGREDAKANTVKAVCNADLGGEFVVGKDVSVPVLRLLGTPRPYENQLGGSPPSERSFLAFFAGGYHGPVRKALLKTWVGRDPDMKIFSKGSVSLSRGNISYVEYMRRSKYCICAAGWHPYSPRTTESIYYDCVPVIIADMVVLPFSDDLDWTKFSVTVPESDIPNLKAILSAIPESQYLALQGALSKVRHHFVWNDPPVKYDAFYMILHGIWTSRLKQLANDT